MRILVVWSHDDQRFRLPRKRTGEPQSLIVVRPCHEDAHESSSTANKKAKRQDLKRKAAEEAAAQDPLFVQ